MNTTTKTLTILAGLTLTAGSAQAQTTLFADNFDRADNTDLNAETAGKSGTLGALDWVEVVSSADPQVVSNQLQIGENGAGGGWSIAYVDHNFTDAAITTSGEFTVSVDLGSPLGSNGGTRFLGFAVGSSQAELDAWATNNPNDSEKPFPTDFFFGYDTTGTNEVKVYINGATQDYQQAIDLDSGGNLSVRFSSITDFNTGSSVSYEAFIDGGSVTTGSFTWSGTNENYLALYSNYTTNQGLLDNFEISTAGGGGGIPADFDGDGFVTNADIAIGISNFTGPQTDPPTFTKDGTTGDTDGDGDDDNGDLATVISSFTGPGPAPVPEPTSLALLGLGGLLIARRRRAYVKTQLSDL